METRSFSAGDNKKEHPYYESRTDGQSTEYTTTFTSGATSSRSFTMGVGVGTPPLSSLQQRHQHDIGFRNQLGTALEDTARTSRRTESTTTTYNESPSEFRERHRTAHAEAEKRFKKHMDRDFAIFCCFALLVLVVVLGSYVWGNFSGGEAASNQGSPAVTHKSSSWAIWIPLGPLWVGYGSEGFLWSFSLSFSF
ncbi:unnamed protein product [Clonostachys rhizophaga]|uniref:Transmembrane protein n=1 Tax=Clonostachys rhizophaga TaxID=160324 RepID=A0A9N9VC41_9HYPO|nr:unnamed protein product [Clonostachys rhizophaga]